MSTMNCGDASLIFIIGIRLCPPDSILASGPCFARSAIASSRVPGTEYSKLRGIILLLPFMQSFIEAFIETFLVIVGSLVEGLKPEELIETGREKTRE